MKNYKALFDQVAIIPIKPEETTDSGIILSLKMTSKIEKGTVVLVGPGIKDDSGFKATEIKEGDIVAFPSNSGTKVSVSGFELIIMRESEIYGVYE